MTSTGSKRLDISARQDHPLLAAAHGRFPRMLYHWHPWFGMRVAIYETVDKADDVVFRCMLSGSRGPVVVQTMSLIMAGNYDHLVERDWMSLARDATDEEERVRYS